MSQGTRSATARTLCPRRLPSPVLAFGGVLLLLWIAPAHAGVLDLAWDAPTTNTDGTPLTDLGHYRVYVGTGSSSCPGGTYQQVPSPSLAPAVGDVVTTTVTGLVAGTTYLAQVTAVATSGSESLCSNQASVATEADALDTPAPTGTLAVTALTANRTAPQPVGTPITFTASATGGSGAYESEWVTGEPGEPWTTVRDWASGLSFTWTPTAENPDYRMFVHVRNAGGTWDPTSQKVLAFPITGP
jgi:hypothetical protein